MLKQIIQSLILNIDNYTDLFHDSNAVTDIVFGVGEATITLNDTLPSTLSVGKNFKIQNALFKNEIVSLTPIIGTGYQAETIVNHDLTEGSQTTVEITGFGGSWDDTFYIISVDSPNQFTFSTGLEAPVGTGYILEDRYGTIRGIQQIKSFTSNTITFDTDTPFTLYDLTNIYINYNYRIGCVYNTESAVKHYNQISTFNKAVIYLIYDSSTASKDVNIDTDSIARFTKTEEISQLIDQNFYLFVIMDNSDENNILNVQNEMLELRFALFKSLIGLTIDYPDFSNSLLFKIVYTGDSPAVYNGAYYGHLFSFQNQLIIGEDETVENTDISAFRNLDLGLFLQFDNYEEVKKTISIDLPNNN